MKRALIVGGVLAITLLSNTSIVFAQASSARDDEDTPDMKAANRRFREREAQRPPRETDYRQTDKYLGKSAQEQRVIDQTTQRNNRYLEGMKGGVPAR